MWNHVVPTSQWIDSQIPSFVANLFEIINRSNRDDSEDEELASIDVETIQLAHANIIAGACLSLGIRFAGTANKDAYKALVERCLYFKDLRDDKIKDKCPNKTTLESCLSTAAIALGMVMAGTGELATFKLLRTLRWRTVGVTYGTHMALNR